MDRKKLLKVKKTSGVYRLFDLATGKSYVGSSICLNKRIKRHFYLLKNNKHTNSLLQEYYDKSANIDFNVLEYCDVDKLFYIEQKYMDMLKPIFNLTLKAKSGGARKGAGRPRKEPTKMLRVPIKWIPKVKELINNWLKNEKAN